MRTWLKVQLHKLGEWLEEIFKDEDFENMTVAERQAYIELHLLQRENRFANFF